MQYDIIYVNAGNNYQRLNPVPVNLKILSTIVLSLKNLTKDNVGVKEVVDTNTVLRKLRNQVIFRFEKGNRKSI